MDAEYSRELLIPMSRCDFSGRLGVADTVSLFMDMAAEVTELLGIGLTAMDQKKFFWLTVRTRCRIHRRPKALAPVRATTWAHAMQRAVCNRYYTLCQGDELLAEGKTEWLVFDLLTGGVASTLDEAFYSFAASERQVCQGAKTRVGREFQPGELLGRYTVRSTDIDIGHHMNNVKYIRAVQSLLSVETQEGLDISEFELSYVRPCLEGEELSVYCRSVAEGYELGIFKQDGTLASTMRVWARIGDRQD